MKVKDLLRHSNKEVITIAPGATIAEAMSRLISHQISCLPVVDEESNVVGIISDRDIFHEAFNNHHNYRDALVGERMTTDVIIGVPDDQISYIAGIMTNNRIRHVPIVEEGKLIGLVSTGDVVKTQMDNLQTENRYLRQYIMQG
jgi:CBS domain-containing protein